MNRFALIILVAAMIVGTGLADDDEVISTGQARCDVIADILLDYGESPLWRTIPPDGDPSDSKWLTVNDTIGGLAKLYGCPPAPAADVAPAAVEFDALDLPNSQANITFPPPVYLVRDGIDIRGTVNSPDMIHYYIEFLPLVQDLTTAMNWSGVEIHWYPATLPRIDPVTQGILGHWYTKGMQDGLYELRLTIYTGAPELQHVYIGPIRVENFPPKFADSDTDND